jgi:hypothetical protein
MRATSFLVVWLLMLAGCVSLPVGPSVAVMPAPGKPFEVFVADETVCRCAAATVTAQCQRMTGPGTPAHPTYGLLWNVHVQTADAGHNRQ